MQYNLLILLILIAPTSLLGCGMSPALPVGSTVEYQVERYENLSNETRTLLNDSTNKYLWLINGERRVYEAKWLPIFSYNQHRYDEHPDRPWIPDLSEIYPLTVGKEIRIKEPWYEASLIFDRTSFVCKTVSQEVITVPAGSFNTYKVLCKQESSLQMFNNYTTFYLSPIYPVFIKRESAPQPLKPIITHSIKSITIN